MRLSQNTSRIVIPTGGAEEDLAFGRTTHLGIGAHPDDLEIMSWHAIGTCHASSDRWFSGVIVTDGAGSPRNGPFAKYSDEDLKQARFEEQRQAAILGEYSALVMLGFSSAAAKATRNTELAADLLAVLRQSKPQFVFTHNLFDAHDTHVAVAVHVIEAIRQLDPHERPRALYGCEVWRSLDWLLESDATVFDVSASEDLGTKLIELYHSQIGGGKRYDSATVARKRLNATYRQPRDVDRSTAAELVVDMTPLVADETLDIHEFAMGFVDRFKTDVSGRLHRALL